MAHPTDGGPPRWVAGPVRVSVPATSANLGPGFDTLGLALDLRDRLEAEVVADGLLVEVDGAGATEVPRDERHLVVRAMHATFDLLGARPPGLVLRCHNVVPHARGLGSSSAAIVGGAALANALVGEEHRLDEATLLDLVARLEGHPDNVAPALLGGFTVAGARDGGFFAVRGDLDPRIGAVVLVPPTRVSTEAARGLLPDAVPHADAVANAGCAALLVTALAGRPALLHAATADRLHQEQRRPAMPATLDLVAALRGEGVAAVVSGAGPTVLALVDREAERGPLSAAAVLARCPDGWAAHDLAVDTDGARPW